MNIYDLNSADYTMYNYDEEAQKLIDSYKKSLLWYRIFVILGGALTIFGVLKLFNIGAYVILLESFILYTVILQFALVLKQNVLKWKSVHAGEKAMHDWDYFLYGHSKAKRIKQTALLAIARVNILTQEYDRAAQALMQINFTKLPVIYQKKFFVLHTILAKASGNEQNYQYFLQQYQQFLQLKKATAEDIEIRSLLEHGDIEAMESHLKTIKNDGDVITVIKAFIALCGAVLFYNTWRLLCLGGVPLSSQLNGAWIQISAITILITALVLIGTLLFGRKKEVKSSVLAVAIIIYIIIVMIGIGILGVFELSVFIDEMNKRDGQSNGSYWNEPYGKDSDADVYGDSDDFDNYGNGSFGTDNLGDNNSDFSANNDSSAASDMTESDDSANNVDDSVVATSDQYWLETAYLAVYENVFAAQGDSCTFAINAKGELYIMLGTGEAAEYNGEPATVNRRLVYDRESANGACYEFVYQQDYFDTSGNQITTGLLNFYAYVIDTGEVIAADKKNWGAGGNEDYRAATGE